MPYKCHRGDLSEATDARAPQSSPTLGRKLPGPFNSRCAREPRTIRRPELRPPGTQPRRRAELRLAAPRARPRYRSPTGPWHGGADAHHGTPVVPPNAKHAARGRACRSLQGGGRASRSSTSERFDSACVRRILRPGQFTHWNGALGAHGAVRPRSNRPPELAAICACATRRCGGRLFRPARATSRRRTTRHPH